MPSTAGSCRSRSRARTAPASRFSADAPLSWDALTQPVALARDSACALARPDLWAMALVFGTLVAVFYACVELRRPPHPTAGLP